MQPSKIQKRRKEMSERGMRERTHIEKRQTDRQTERDNSKLTPSNCCPLS
jgi:hypothetical protein